MPTLQRRKNEIVSHEHKAQQTHMDTHTYREKPTPSHKQTSSALLHTGHGSPVWRKCITAPAAILRPNPLSSPQAAIGTLQVQLYCCDQLLHAAWVMSSP